MWKIGCVRLQEQKDKIAEKLNTAIQPNFFSGNFLNIKDHII
jgi:hypothetical protein